MPRPVRYWTKPMQSSIILVRYCTEIMDAKLPMPASVSSMLMPSYVVMSVPTVHMLTLHAPVWDIYKKNQLASHVSTVRMSGRWKVGKCCETGWTDRPRWLSYYQTFATKLTPGKQVIVIDDRDTRDVLHKCNARDVQGVLDDCDARDVHDALDDYNARDMSLMTIMFMMFMSFLTMMSVMCSA
jgi:hypothetical protein